MTTSGSRPLPEEHTSNVRHGEVTLLLRPNTSAPAQAASRPLPRSEWPTPSETGVRALEALFRGLGVPLLEGGNSCRGVDDEIRQLIPVPRFDNRSRSDGARPGGAALTPFALLTVNLASWLPYPLHMGTAPTALEAIDRSIADVGTAVARLNDLIGQTNAGPLIEGYEIVAAAPNWLGTALDDGCSDAAPPQGALAPPGGRGRDFPRFDPLDVHNEVESGLHALARAGAQAYPVSDRYGDGVRVAVLDSWPIDKTRGDWLALLKDARARQAQLGHDTTRHDELLSALATATFRDYVTGTPLELMHSHRRNSKGILEPKEPHRDHGLFVSDIINQIAPLAALNIYRVLNDNGVGQFDFVAAAVAEAISDAQQAHQPLVFNMSLAFGPVLAMLRQFLAAPLTAHQTGNLWSRSTIAALKKGPNMAAELLAADDLAMKAATLVCAVHSFPGAFAIAAAGNDSFRPGWIAAPREPAVVEGVLGVSAAPMVERAGKRELAPGFSSYSDNDDVEAARDDGVTAFGGEIEETPGNTSTSVMGPIGLSISKLRGKVPDYDRVMWSGTSFAAPVVTGLAACIWSEAPGLPSIAVPNAGAFPPAEDLLTAIVKPNMPTAHRIALVQK